MARRAILLVDDEEELLKAMRIRLASWGYNVLTATNGKEAIELVKKRLPNAVILDIMMPKMDGYTFVHELKKRLETLPPIIVLTAKQKMQDLFALEGIKDYVVKPFEHQDLLAKIDKLLKEKE